jgi:PiT family inorganic phosphate transporter
VEFGIGQVDLVIGLAIGLGLYTAFSIGANDVANAMGTSVGSGALTIRRAIIVAALLEFAGAYLVGGHVTKTIRGGILDPEVVGTRPDVVIAGMLAALTAAGTWLIFASRLGWPVSTTHSIVGAIAGFGAVALGWSAVEWGKLGRIVASWLVSPLLSGTLAIVIYSITRRLILDRENPVRQLQRWGPLYVFAVIAVIGMVTLFKGLKNMHLDFSLSQALAITMVLGLVGAGIAALLLGRLRPDPNDDRSFHFATVERMFGSLQVMSACAVAFAHGSNDVANAIGPMAAVVETARGGVVEAEAAVPAWILLVGGAGIVVGLATLGYRVMATIGEKITELTPTRGYAAEFAAAITIVVASRFGLPVSTTHTLVGAVLGVGLARGIGALDFRVIGTIILAWVVTLPVGAALAIFFYYFYRGLLSSLGGA